MELFVDLEPEAVQKAESLAAERGQSIGKVLGDAILRELLPSKSFCVVETDDQGWPVIRTGRPITSEEIKAMIAEDEEWEITRGNPDHPYYKSALPDQEPVVTRGATGLPEIRFRRSIRLEPEV